MTSFYPTVNYFSVLPDYSERLHRARRSQDSLSSGNHSQSQSSEHAIALGAPSTPPKPLQDAKSEYCQFVETSDCYIVLNQWKRTEISSGAFMVRNINSNALLICHFIPDRTAYTVLPASTFLLPYPKEQKFILRTQDECPAVGDKILLRIYILRPEVHKICADSGVSGTQDLLEHLDKTTTQICSFELLISRIDISNCVPDDREPDAKLFENPDSFAECCPLQTGEQECTDTDSTSTCTLQSDDSSNTSEQTCIDVRDCSPCSLRPPNLPEQKEKLEQPLDPREPRCNPEWRKTSHFSLCSDRSPKHEEKMDPCEITKARPRAESQTCERSSILDCSLAEDELPNVENYAPLGPCIPDFEPKINHDDVCTTGNHTTIPVLSPCSLEPIEEVVEPPFLTVDSCKLLQENDWENVKMPGKQHHIFWNWNENHQMDMNHAWYNYV